MTNKTDLTQFEDAPHIKAILNYSQADAEGIMVNVSRQAIHETVEENGALRAEVERLREIEAAVNEYLNDDNFGTHEYVDSTRKWARVERMQKAVKGCKRKIT